MDNNKTTIPEDKTPPYPLMLTLHAGGGVMSEEHNLWRSIVDQGYVLGMPRSKNLYWAKDGAYWADYESEVRLVKQYVDKLNNSGLLDLKKTILSGLSSGAALAIRIALSGAISTRAFVVVAPGDSRMKDIDEWLPLIKNTKNKELKGIIIRGENDTAIPRENTLKLVKMLNDGGISCKLVEYPNLGHWYPSDIVKVVTSFLESI